MSSSLWRRVYLISFHSIRYKTYGLSVKYTIITISKILSHYLKSIHTMGLVRVKHYVHRSYQYDDDLVSVVSTLGFSSLVRRVSVSTRRQCHYHYRSSPYAYARTSGYPQSRHHGRALHGRAAKSGSIQTIKRINQSVPIRFIFSHYMYIYR